VAATHGALKFLALITWLTGGLVLFFKGYSLWAEADGLRPGAALNYIPFPVAAVAGALKVKYVFLPGCRRNLLRIGALPDPRLWQFFRPGFFLFLFSMILLGVSLSRHASGHYTALLVVSTVDLTLSVGLLGSLKGFRR
jgi:hypothetical protein